MNEQLRRHAVGAPAARSVLLTMLGEYVLPASGSAWQETLIGALGAVGHKTHAARQALARSIAAGWLRTERHGRRSRVHLMPDTAEMLRSGAQRIYSFGEPWDWDGHWLLVVLRVPEERREVRHQVRTRLAWAGFGSLGGGLWITPHVERERELRDLTGGGVAEVVSFRAEVGDLGDPRKVIADAWDLGAVAEAYRAFAAQFGRMRPNGPEATFRAQTLLVHEWRRFPFLDPDLPDDLLPARWPRRRAHELFAERHAQWHPTAQQHFAALEAAGGAPDVAA
ncbi:MAG TPA: PaaX family transcriptional regulator C-terminal domain-containing protein [Solirubrobacteraceae bacterium]|nr:PaaX family transcriptional regulator C-terminal domain-containing protein [Solirubrobacteraceae bacterium]